MAKHETVIGLEVHLQLFTKTKAFCGCKNEFGLEPNSSVCPVCLGLPGSLPVLNEQYLEYAVKVALALNCRIENTMKFDRKNYFYPDLPKGYQISQYDMPLSHNGWLKITDKNDRTKKIGIRRVHMEEDAGKLLHLEENISLVDFNRCGTPLLEIVSEPDMASLDEAYLYLTTLKSTLEYLGVSDCDMEKGSLRCDANISIKPAGSSKEGVKVELKNMNSFKAVKAALEYEQKRQCRLLDKNEEVIQQTRLWNPDKRITEQMRMKEEAHDYRYFPDPDLTPFVIDKALIDKAEMSLPELPTEKKARFIKEFGVSDYDAGVLVSDKALADYFERCTKLYDNPKAVVNCLTTEVLGCLNLLGQTFADLKLPPQYFVDMLKMIDQGKISTKIAKELVKQMIKDIRHPKDIVEEKGLLQISDSSELKEAIKEIIKQNPQAVEDYRKGRTNAITYLVGQVMKATKGKANPGMLNKMLKEELA